MTHHLTAQEDAYASPCCLGGRAASLRRASRSKCRSNRARPGAGSRPQRRRSLLLETPLRPPAETPRGVLPRCNRARSDGIVGVAREPVAQLPLYNAPQRGRLVAHARRLAAFEQRRRRRVICTIGACCQPDPP
eukprot:CAMPEP_0115834112 /NCGR_PEP_ID=MMETSP0287-20121206/3517_1 /TAXON_ID=412157 /ORGANISM="Chrysochromulina rotalis, Strain UIO044" /LENGTH=133 /DNA_ID=CAMNT_0003287541 /DNA_START=243 /DNA_END=640 /DNA_ORIENTATION=+